MDTSKSADEQRAHCTASILLFSGRPAPEWPLAAETVGALLDLWQRMNPTEVSLPEPPALGYRGCVLNCGVHGLWSAYGGAVIAGQQRRRDIERRFEQTILRSAPAGLVPARVLRDVLDTLS